MRSTLKILWAIASLLILASCSLEQPTGPATPSTGDPAKSEDPIIINNYAVQYDGRSFDGQETTFAYTVYSTGCLEDLTSFRLELPDGVGELSCWSPTSSVSFLINPDTGLQLIKWHLTIEGDDAVGRQYSITYPGEVGEGMIRGAVKAGTVLEYGDIPGPGAEVTEYLITGTVYDDFDGDGMPDFEELGMANVAVELVSAGGSVTAAFTDSQGLFSFDATAGDYTLRIVYDGYPDAFNAELEASFDATTPLEVEVSVGPDSVGTEFGFTPRTEEIIDDLETGDLNSTGEDRIFWKQQVRWAIVGADNANVVHDREELETFIQTIQGLYLTEIFQFTPGNELQEVWEILRPVPRAPIDKLKQQLLITELNEVSGRGIVDNPELQDVLIAWGEAVWVDNQEAAARAGGRYTGEGDLQDVSLARPDLIPPAIDIFTLINTGGGGGVDE